MENLTELEKTILTTKFLRICGNRREPYLAREDFAELTQCKKKFFSDRLFHMMDVERRGRIRCAEFIGFVSRFAGKGAEDKIRFLFELYDTKDDGILDRKELHDMLEACMTENGMKFEDTQIDALVDALLDEETGSQIPGRPCFGRPALLPDDFEKLFTKHGDLLTNLSTIIEKWLLPEEIPQRDEEVSKTSCCPRICSWHNICTQFNIWMLIYISINFGLLGLKAWIFLTTPENSDFTEYLCAARMAGIALDFNAVFVIIAMLQHTLTFLRTNGFHRIFPIDHNRTFHETAGKFIFLFSIIHTISHLLNLEFGFLPSEKYNMGNWTFFQFLFLPQATNGEGDSGIKLGFFLLPGFAYSTGFGLLLILSIMVIGALPSVRKKLFYTFYLTHRLYFIFYIILILHCRNFWIWFIAPGILFLIEKAYRCKIILRSSKTYVKSGVVLPSKVVNLIIKRPEGFQFSPGDYIIVNIPKFGKYEWHPFTISSAPENEEELGLHIRAVGHWTNALYNHFDYNKRCKMVIEHPHSSSKRVSRNPPSPTTKVPNDEGTRTTLVIESSTEMPSTSTQVNVRSIIDHIKSSKNFSNIEANKEVLPLNQAVNRNRLSLKEYKHLRKWPPIINLTVPNGNELSPSECPLNSNTESLQKLLTSSNEEELVSSNAFSESDMGDEITIDESLKINIDGPFGAPANTIFWAEHAVLIGTGIGVTPFASILQSIMHRHWSSYIPCPHCQKTFSHQFHQRVHNLRKVDFFWINQDQNSFDWFANLLSNLEIEQEELGGGMERFLDIHMYMTTALQRGDMKAVGLQLALDLLYEKGEKDLVAGLKSRMNAGRPKWNEIFKRLSEECKGQVTVYFCGPPALGNTLDKFCKEFKFRFTTEVF